MSERASATRRSTLLARHDPDESPTRDTLASHARHGMRGLLIERPVRLAAAEPVAAARFLHLLVEAAGVGLRVYWEGTLDGVPAGPLRHLDPPRQNGTPLWPVPPGPLLTVRRGPDFVTVEDMRDPGAHRRSTVPDQPYGELLRRYAVPTAPRPPDRRGLAELEARGLVLRLGGPGEELCLALPVRFAYARS
ncbi:DUF5825 family protein [Streptomyces sp. NPDC058052]|uniref:DUF5825 family protein n=1 Tax=Streptomyces sp. NPDC058052 TaxID=3346316 RepID=UPI0036F01589